MRSLFPLSPLKQTSVVLENSTPMGSLLLSCIARRGFISYGDKQLFYRGIDRCDGNSPFFTPKKLFFSSAAGNFRPTGQYKESPMNDTFIKQDDNSEFARLMAKHHRSLYHYIYSLHPNASQAEDILQETSISIFKHFDQYDAERPFLPWAFKFAYFEVKRFRRNCSRDRLVIGEELVEIMATERTEYHEELEIKRQRLFFCVKKLVEEDQKLLRWRYYTGKTLKDIAESLNLPVKTPLQTTRTSPHHPAPLHDR